MDLQINSTYGTSEVWRAHPMNSPITLKAGQTGPIELTFFLSQMIPSGTGRIRVGVMPPLPTPAGVLKCYYFSTIPATCDVFSTAEETYFEITPPRDY